MRYILQIFVIAFIISSCKENRKEPLFDILELCEKIETQNIHNEYKGFSIFSNDRRNTIMINGAWYPTQYEVDDFDINDPNKLKVPSCHIEELLKKQSFNFIKRCVDLGIIAFMSRKNPQSLIIATNTFEKKSYDPQHLKNSPKYRLIYFYEKPDSSVIENMRYRKGFEDIKKIKDKWYYNTSTIDWNYFDVANKYPWFYLLKNS